MQKTKKSHPLWLANNLLIDGWEQNKFVCVCWAPSESGSEEKKNRDFGKCLRLLKALKKKLTNISIEKLLAALPLGSRVSLLPAWGKWDADKEIRGISRT